ncbi:MAG: hypothetical protein M1838_004277 [Thelocarpon superellum]|nr:MAG: hypothetical protein M1838_004277 [Thelocarpon superellum]
MPTSMAAACLVALFLAAVVHADNSGYPLNIDWRPAPSPEDGPPLSAHASRDRSLLPMQIGAIVGAYAVTVLFLTLALTFVGRRLRGSIQTSPRSLDVEMLKPVRVPSHFDPSPVSADSKRTLVWPPSWNSHSPPKYSSNEKTLPKSPISPPPNFSWPSPTRDTFVSFDERVIEEDKQRRNLEMEKLYSAVMEDEAAREERRKMSMSSSGSGQARARPVAPTLRSPEELLGRSRTKSPPRALDLTRQRSPARKKSPPRLETLSPPPDKAVKEKSRSHRSSLASSLSIKTKRGKSIRGLPISSPVPTPTTSLHSRTESKDEPLTPLFPPPAPPIQQRRPSPTRAAHHQRKTSDKLSALPRLAPVNPPAQSQTQAGSSAGPSAGTSAAASAVSIDAELHAYHTGRLSNNNSTSTSTTRSSPKPLPFRSAGAGTGPSASSITVGGASASSSTTKITVLERAARPGPNSPLSPGAVPYSPYMPFTPLTPISPRLVTKKERKAMQKEEGRGVVKEMIKSEGELFDAGY